MKHPQTSFRPHAKNLQAAGAQVKAKVIAAGLKLSDLADAAGLAPSTLTNYLTGHRKSAETQVRIVRAFRRLTRTRIAYSEFWGPLWDRDSHAA